MDKVVSRLLTADNSQTIPVQAMPRFAGEQRRSQTADRRYCHILVVPDL